MTTKQVNRSDLRVGDRIVTSDGTDPSEWQTGWMCGGVLEVIKLPDAKGRPKVKCSGCQQEWRTGLGGIGGRLIIEVV